VSIFEWTHARHDDQSPHCFAYHDTNFFNQPTNQPSEFESKCRASQRKVGSFVLISRFLSLASCGTIRYMRSTFMSAPRILRTRCGVPVKNNQPTMCVSQCDSAHRFTWEVQFSSPYTPKGLQTYPMGLDHCSTVSRGCRDSMCHTTSGYGHVNDWGVRQCSNDGLKESLSSCKGT
jgi:hypothetical protein